MFSLTSIESEAAPMLDSIIVLSGGGAWPGSMICSVLRRRQGQCGVLGSLVWTCHSRVLLGFSQNLPGVDPLPLPTPSGFLLVRRKPEQATPKEHVPHFGIIAPGWSSTTSSRDGLPKGHMTRPSAAKSKVPMSIGETWLDDLPQGLGHPVPPNCRRSPLAANSPTPSQPTATVPG